MRRCRNDRSSANGGLPSTNATNTATHWLARKIKAVTKFSVLPAQPGATRLLVERRVHVTITRSTLRGISKAGEPTVDVLAHRAVDRDHGLGAQQDIGSE